MHQVSKRTMRWQWTMGFSMQETEDAFLMKLNEKNMGPSEYAAAVLVEHSLNRQQIFAIAPIAWVMEQMWVNRAQLESCRADGACNESCNCLWLGAGGSGKTHAYTRVLKEQRRPNQEKIEGAMAMLLDELSMAPPDVYHAGAFRFAMTRQEHWRLEIVRYLEQWFGKVPIGVELADFLQLRPTACLSLCAWQKRRRPRATTKRRRALKRRRQSAPAMLPN